MSRPLLPDHPLVGVDLGGTNVRAGVVVDGRLERVVTDRVPAEGSLEEVLGPLVHAVEGVITDDVGGIGVGVPSVVDLERGVVYDVQNIPSWDEVPLKEILEERFSRPVRINNDANCFALGERYFGKGREHESFVALILGTGFAGGIVLDGALYPGSHCGAGEFGMMPYRDSIFEHYCSGQFFDRAYGISGEEAAGLAADGHVDALAMFEAFGEHLGNALQAILYAVDPSTFILGGSVSRSFRLFESSMHEALAGFAYGRALERLTIAVSELDQPGILGAAALLAGNELTD